MSVPVQNNLFHDSKASVRSCAVADITLSGEQTTNGVALKAGDRVLCIAQSPASENGIYEVKTGAWVRDDDSSSFEHRKIGSYVYPREGTACSEQFLVQSSSNVWQPISVKAFTQQDVTFVQTFATATETHAARTAVTGTGADGTTPSGAEYLQLVADQVNTASVVNELIDLVQTLGLAD